MNELTCESAGVSEGPDLGVRESDQPDDEGVQHVLIIENAVLALKNDVVDEVHKVTLKERRGGEGISVIAIDAAYGKLVLMYSGKFLKGPILQFNWLTV